MNTDAQTAAMIHAAANAGSSCVQYAAKKWFTWGKGSFLEIKTPDGNKYDFNTAGWSILIVEK